jgi:RNA polymerase sigma-70 factor, ECF subfamily
MNMESNHTHPFRVDLYTFNQLFREQYPALRAYAAFLVGDHAAEDLVQDLFLYTWENRETITIHTSVKAWLFKSIHNRCLNNLKRTQMLHHNHRQIESGLNEQEMLLADPEKNHIIQKLYMNELRTEINQAIDSLPNKCREVFILSYLEAFKNKQISQELNISVSTVEKHINHALKTLRKTLEHIKILFLNFLLL